MMPKKERKYIDKVFVIYEYTSMGGFIEDVSVIYECTSKLEKNSIVDIIILGDILRTTLC